MRTIQAKLVRADGQRVSVTVRNTTMLSMLYHVAQVYPGHTSCQLITIKREEARHARNQA